MIICRNTGTGGTTSINMKVRRINYVSDTEFHIMQAQQIGTTTENTTDLIPTKICGLK